MNDTLIVTVFSVIDDVLQVYEHHDHCLAQVCDAELLTVAVVAARYFQNHHERALFVMQGLGYLSGHISISRFNRRLHQASVWFSAILALVCDLFAVGEIFIIDSLSLPVCKRVRAWRCKKVRGAEYCGYCSAKKEKFFGWRLHLICTHTGIPVSFELLPAAFHDLTPVHELTYALPTGACVYGDKAYNALADEATLLTEISVRLIPIRRKNMKQHRWADEFDLHTYRHSIETLNSQLESMGINRLHARTNAGFDIKVWASLLALSFSNSLN